jgi:CheY-like chemotaxis protein
MTNIMIVEDEFIIAMETKSNLIDLGYNVTSIVDSGEKVIAKIKENMPDLILMDIRIKGKKDGIEVAELIRSDHSMSIPLIFLSAYAEDEKLDRAKLVYPSGYLIKPVQGRELKASIEMAIHASTLVAQRIKYVEELQLVLKESRNKCDVDCDLRNTVNGSIDNIK